MTGRYRSPKLLAGFGLLLSMTLAPEAFARGNDIAPAPSRAPRTAVHQQVLGGSKAPAAPPRFIEGPAVTLENERIRIGDVDLRLFGIVPPQLSAPFGPQARSVLDTLIGTGFVSCTIKDRERDGRLLASCKSDHSGDFALDLLRRGLAVTARGSLHGSDLLSSYLAAEQAAQTQRLGLWSVKVPSAASDSSLREAAQANADKAAAAAKEAAEAKQAKAEQPVKPELQPEVPPLTSKAKAEAETPKAPEPKAADLLSPVALPASALKPGAGTKLPVETKQQIPVLADALQAEIAAALDDAVDDTTPGDPSWSRFQFLLGCLVLALTGFGVTAGRAWNNARARRAAHRDVADALMGELTAARATCQQRLAQLQTAKASASTGFPRLRSIVFQAYANRLGLLGPVLSRQIGSIYGQAADYAAYFNAPLSAEGTTPPRPYDSEAKKQALETIVGYIDAVLPQLAPDNKAPVNHIAPNKQRGKLFKRAVQKAAQKSKALFQAFFSVSKQALTRGGCLLRSVSGSCFTAIQSYRTQRAAAQALATAQKTPPLPSPQNQAPVEQAIQTETVALEAAPSPEQPAASDETASPVSFTPMPSFAPEFIDLSHPDHEPEALPEPEPPLSSVTAPVEVQKVEPPAAPPPVPPTAATPLSSERAPTPSQPLVKAKPPLAQTKRATGKSKQNKPKTAKAAPKEKTSAKRDTAENDGETLWVKLRHLAQMHAHPRATGKGHDLDDGFYATYGGLTAEEIEALAFGDTPADENELFAAHLPSSKQGKR